MTGADVLRAMANDVIKHGLDARSFADFIAGFARDTGRSAPDVLGEMVTQIQRDCPAASSEQLALLLRQRADELDPRNESPGKPMNEAWQVAELLEEIGKKADPQAREPAAGQRDDPVRVQARRGRDHACRGAGGAGDRRRCAGDAPSRLQHAADRERVVASRHPTALRDALASEGRDGPVPARRYRRSVPDWVLNARSMRT
jgi:hypothetical protein